MNVFFSVCIIRNKIWVKIVAFTKIHFGLPHLLLFRAQSPQLLGEIGDLGGKVKKIPDSSIDPATEAAIPSQLTRCD
jgi:hypothetical protein